MLDQERKLKEMIEKTTGTLTSSQDKLGKQQDVSDAKFKELTEQLEEMKADI